jgi:hypothetical protein
VIILSLQSHVFSIELHVQPPLRCTRRYQRDDNRAEGREQNRDRFA